MKGFARGLALKKRHKTIRKWPIKLGSSGVTHWNLLLIVLLKLKVTCLPDVQDRNITPLCTKIKPNLPLFNSFCCRIQK